MTRFLLKSLPLPLIIIDWSPLTDDQSQQLLRAALPVGGRALSLYEEVHPDSQLGNRRVQHQFLACLHQVLPVHVKPIIVADSGFRTPFFREVERLNWHWLGRIRNRDFIALADLRMTGNRQNGPMLKRPARLSYWAWHVGYTAIPLSGQLVTFYRPAQGRKQLTV